MIPVSGKENPQSVPVTAKIQPVPTPLSMPLRLELIYNI